MWPNLAKFDKRLQQKIPFWGGGGRENLVQFVCFSVFGARIVMRDFTSTKMRVFWKQKCLIPLCILLIKTLASRFLPMIFIGYHENHFINKWIQFLCFGNAVGSGLLLELGLSQLHLTEVLIPVKPEPWNFAPVRQEKEEDSRREREREKEGSRGGRFSRSPTKEFCQVNWQTGAPAYQFRTLFCPFEVWTAFWNYTTI